MYNGKFWVQGDKYAVLHKFAKVFFSDFIARTPPPKWFKESPEFAANLSKMSDTPESVWRNKIVGKYKSDRAQREALINAKSEPFIVATPEMFDAVNTGHLLNVQNGIIDLNTITLIPHSPKYLVTKYIDVPWLLEAHNRSYCPIVDETLENLMGEYVTPYDPKDSVGGNKITHDIPLAHVSNYFGGSRTYFLCPLCHTRRRYIYFHQRRFICRVCADLTHKSTQLTKGSTEAAKHRIQAFIKVSFKDSDISPTAAVYRLPQRPSGMHHKKYHQLITRLLALQAEHEACSNRRYDQLMELGYRRWRH